VADDLEVGLGPLGGVHGAQPLLDLGRAVGDLLLQVLHQQLLVRLEPGLRPNKEDAKKNAENMSCYFQREEGE
jgi:hypothetical protein